MHALDYCYLYCYVDPCVNGKYSGKSFSLFLPAYNAALKSEYHLLSNNLYDYIHNIHILDPRTIN